MSYSHTQSPMAHNARQLFYSNPHHVVAEGWKVCISPRIHPSKLQQIKAFYTGSSSKAHDTQTLLIWTHSHPGKGGHVFRIGSMEYTCILYKCCLIQIMNSWALGALGLPSFFLSTCLQWKWEGKLLQFSVQIEPSIKESILLSNKSALDYIIITHSSTSTPSNPSFFVSQTKEYCGK